LKIGARDGAEVLLGEGTQPFIALPKTGET